MEEFGGRSGVQFGVIGLQAVAAEALQPPARGVDQWLGVGCQPALQRRPVIMVEDMPFPAICGALDPCPVGADT